MAEQTVTSASHQALLRACAAELDRLAQACGATEMAIGQALPREPQLCAQTVHQLQDLDRIRQTLVQLSRLLDGLGAAQTATDIETQLTALTLEGLVDRLSGLTARSGADPPPQRAPPDVHLF